MILMMRQVILETMHAYAAHFNAIQGMLLWHGGGFSEAHYRALEALSASIYFIAIAIEECSIAQIYPGKMTCS